MQKSSLLQSSILLSQLEARLEKNPYLSRSSLPSCEDARVFLAIERLKQTPNRASHPCLYHWFVIMKQFARRTLEKWVSEGEEDHEQDQLINQFVLEVHSSLLNKKSINRPNSPNPPPRRLFEEKFDHSQNIVTSPKNTKRRISQNYVEFNQNTNLSQKEILHSPFAPSPNNPHKHLFFNILAAKNDHYFLPVETEYVMEMQLNHQNTNSFSTLRDRLAKERLDLLSFELRDEINLQIIFRIQAEQCEGLKDRISQWPEVANIRFRREKKNAVLHQIKSEKVLNSPLRIFSNA